MISISEQCIMFCAAALTGLLTGAGFSFCSALKKEFSLKKSAPFVDFIFWVFALYIFFYFLNISGNGQLRAFVFLGVFSGYLFYLLVFAELVSKALAKFLNILAAMLKTILKPLFFISSKTLVLLKKIREIVQNKQKEVEKIVKKRLEKNQKNSII